MTSRIEHNNPKGKGELDLTYHYEMLSDPKRIPPFKEAIEACAKDAIVLESGTGSGILSLLAARAGAKKVYATELDPKVAAFARSNFEKNGYQNITLLEKSTTELTLSDLDGNRPTVIIAENLSTWQVTEPEIQVMNHITEELAAENAIRIPEVMSNYVGLCYAPFEFLDLVTLRSHFFEFTGIPSAKTMSKAELYSTLAFQEKNDTAFEKTVQLTASETGTVNAVRLTSPLKVHADVTFDSSDSLMPPVVVPLERDLTVSAGDRVDLYIQYESCANWDTFSIRAELNP